MVSNNFFIQLEGLYLNSSQTCVQKLLKTFEAFVQVRNNFNIFEIKLIGAACECIREWAWSFSYIFLFMTLTPDFLCLLIATLANDSPLTPGRIKLPCQLSTLIYIIKVACSCFRSRLSEVWKFTLTLTANFSGHILIWTWLKTVQGKFATQTRLSNPKQTKTWLLPTLAYWQLSLCSGSYGNGQTLNSWLWVSSTALLVTCLDLWLCCFQIWLFILSFNALMYFHIKWSNSCWLRRRAWNGRYNWKAPPLQGSYFSSSCKRFHDSERRLFRRYTFFTVCDW